MQTLIILRYAQADLGLCYLHMMADCPFVSTLRISFHCNVKYHKMTIYGNKIYIIGSNALIAKCFSLYFTNKMLSYCYHQDNSHTATKT